MSATPRPTLMMCRRFCEGRDTPLAPSGATRRLGGATRRRARGVHPGVHGPWPTSDRGGPLSRASSKDFFWHRLDRGAARGDSAEARGEGVHRGRAAAPGLHLRGDEGRALAQFAQFARESRPRESGRAGERSSASPASKAPPPPSTASGAWKRVSCGHVAGPLPVPPARRPPGCACGVCIAGSCKLEAAATVRTTGRWGRRPRRPWTRTRTRSGPGCPGWSASCRPTSRRARRRAS